MSRALIFDCDGVLVESEFLANRSEYQALRALGCELGPEQYAELGSAA